MEEVFQAFAEYAALGLEVIAILVVVLGGAEAAYRSFLNYFRERDLEVAAGLGKPE